jgi:hypothetical protein
MLEAEVVGDESVVAASAVRLVAVRASVFQRKRGKVNTCGPALRSIGQLGHLRRFALQIETPQQQNRLSPAQWEFLDADLEEAAGRARAGDRQPR